MQEHQEGDGDVLYEESKPSLLSSRTAVQARRRGSVDFQHPLVLPQASIALPAAGHLQKAWYRLNTNAFVSTILVHVYELVV